MITFEAKGHKNILSTHKTTLEFTKDKELTERGDCILGVSCDFDAEQLKEFVKKHKSMLIEISVGSLNDSITADSNPEFNSDDELVIRKSEFVSERTFGINADKASTDIDRKIVDELKAGKTATVSIKPA